MKIAVFLRAVNLGPKNNVAMGDLRNILMEAGFTDVKTYLNSGNLTMKSQAGNIDDAQHIKALILQHFHIDIDVFAVSIEQLAGKIERGIFGTLSDKQVDYVVFLSREIDLDVPCDVQHIHILAVSGKMLFCIGTMSDEHTSFPNALIEKKYKVRCTSRNLNTLKKMIEASK